MNPVGRNRMVPPERINIARCGNKPLITYVVQAPRRL